MLLISKTTKFDAAHFLPFYKGKCHNLHGHTYKLQVTISGFVMTSGTKTGMIMDFSILKQILQEEVIDEYDHKDLNCIFTNPTAEVMVDRIAKDLSARINFYPNMKLEEVRLWETEDSCAIWRKENESE